MTLKKFVDNLGTIGLIIAGTCAIALLVTLTMTVITVVISDLIL